MSESSDSVHVLEGETDAVVAALRAIGATALVLPKTGRHVTVVLRPSEVTRWSAESTRPLLLWRFDADHGLSLSLHAGGKRRATLAREDDAPWAMTGARAWTELAGWNAERREALVGALAPGKADLARCAEELAAALGLSDVAWVAARDLRGGDGIEELRRRFPRATYLRAGRPARWTTPAEVESADREQRAWSIEAREVVTGAPLLAPPSPPLRRGARPRVEPPWVIEGASDVVLAIENFGGEARGVTVEVESALLARGACRVVGVAIDGAPLAGATVANGVWRGTAGEVAWPAAKNPALPTPSATRRLHVRLESLAPDRGPLMVRVVPGSSVDDRGRLVIGRSLEVRFPASG